MKVGSAPNNNSTKQQKTSGQNRKKKLIIGTGFYFENKRKRKNKKKIYRTWYILCPYKYRKVENSGGEVLFPCLTYAFTLLPIFH